jgi:prepilin-type processing-associated H-X9-DG protein
MASQRLAAIYPQVLIQIGLHLRHGGGVCNAAFCRERFRIEFPARLRAGRRRNLLHQPRIAEAKNGYF